MTLNVKNTGAVPGGRMKFKGTGGGRLVSKVNTPKPPPASGYNILIGFNDASSYSACSLLSAEDVLTLPKVFKSLTGEDLTPSIGAGIFFSAATRRPNGSAVLFASYGSYTGYGSVFWRISPDGEPGLPIDAQHPGFSTAFTVSTFGEPLALLNGHVLFPLLDSYNSTYPIVSLRDDDAVTTVYTLDPTSDNLDMSAGVAMDLLPDGDVLLRASQLFTRPDDSPGTRAVYRRIFSDSSWTELPSDGGWGTVVSAAAVRSDGSCFVAGRQYINVDSDVEQMVWTIPPAPGSPSYVKTLYDGVGDPHAYGTTSQYVPGCIDVEVGPDGESVYMLVEDPLQARRVLKLDSSNIVLWDVDITPVQGTAFHPGGSGSEGSKPMLSVRSNGDALVSGYNEFGKPSYDVRVIKVASDGTGPWASTVNHYGTSPFFRPRPGSFDPHSSAYVAVWSGFGSQMFFSTYDGTTMSPYVDPGAVISPEFVL